MRSRGPGLSRGALAIWRLLPGLRDCVAATPGHQPPGGSANSSHPAVLSAVLQPRPRGGLDPFSGSAPSLVQQRVWFAAESASRSLLEATSWSSLKTFPSPSKFCPGDPPSSSHPRLLILLPSHSSQSFTAVSKLRRVPQYPAATQPVFRTHRCESKESTNPSLRTTAMLSKPYHCLHTILGTPSLVGYLEVTYHRLSANAVTFYFNLILLFSFF